MTKISSFLGLVQKANAYVVGTRLMEAIRKQKVYLVLVSDEASARSLKQYSDKCHFYEIPMRKVDRFIFQAFRQHIFALGITNKEMAQKIQEEMR